MYKYMYINKIDALKKAFVVCFFLLSKNVYLKLKTAYVVSKKIGGIFIWSIDMDDFSGKFCDLGAFPLIKNRY